MRLLIMLLLGLGVGGAMYYYIAKQQDGLQPKIDSMQQSAQEKADAYKSQQADMMRQIQNQ